MEVILAILSRPLNVTSLFKEDNRNEKEQIIQHPKRRPRNLLLKIDTRSQKHPVYNMFLKGHKVTPETVHFNKDSGTLQLSVK